MDVFERKNHAADGTALARRTFKRTKQRHDTFRESSIDDGRTTVTLLVSGKKGEDGIANTFASFAKRLRNAELIREPRLQSRFTVSRGKSQRSLSLLPRSPLLARRGSGPAPGRNVLRNCHQRAYERRFNVPQRRPDSDNRREIRRQGLAAPVMWK